jgi:hypothetical protein
MTTQDYDSKQIERQLHYEAELERLRGGLEGCGCSLCQGIYSTIDLTKFGSRVKKYGNIIIITDGKEGADLWGKHNMPDYWEPEGFYVTGGKKYGVTPTGATVCLGDAVAPPVKSKPRANVVATPDGVILIGEKDATSIFRDAVSQKMTAYKTAKILKDREINVSCRTVGRIMSKLSKSLAVYG